MKKEILVDLIKLMFNKYSVSIFIILIIIYNVYNMFSNLFKI